MRIPIAREGYPFILAAAVAAVLVPRIPGLSGFSLPLWALCLFIVSFFRDPDRFVPVEENQILSPADGTVIKITDVDEPRFLNGRAKMVSIFMSVFNCHVNRVPISGVVKYIHYNPGEFRMAFVDKASDLNEANLVGIEAGATRILVKQIAGLIARRIVCDVKVDDEVAIGRRYGMIRFGSRVDVYFPPSVELRVNLDDKVYGGLTILGEIT